MRALLMAAAVGVAASLTGFASAAPPVAVSIQIHPIPPFQAGTWDASGAIDDSGTYERTDVHGTGSLPDCFCILEHTGTFQETFVLTGSGGTLTIKAEEQVTPDGTPFGQETGVWQVVSGTGDYVRASGHGTDVFGPPLTLYLTGLVSKS